MQDYSKMFMEETRHYNSTNFRKLRTCLDISHPVLNQPTWKALTSLTTRYWLFIEKHPELTESDRHMLYFLLGIDRIGKLMASYPRIIDEDFQGLIEQLIPVINEVLADEQSKTRATGSGSAAGRLLDDHKNEIQNNNKRPAARSGNANRGNVRGFRGKHKRSTPR